MLFEAMKGALILVVFAFLFYGVAYAVANLLLSDSLWKKNSWLFYCFYFFVFRVNFYNLHSNVGGKIK